MTILIHKTKRSGKSVSAHAQKDNERLDFGSRQQLIAEKAYELYENRVRADGSDLEDWFQAEALVKEELRQK